MARPASLLPEEFSGGMTDKDIKDMEKAGFLEWEIDRFVMSDALNTASATWRDMLEDRRSMRKNIRRAFFNAWELYPDHTNLVTDPYIWWHAAYQPSKGEYSTNAAVHNRHARAVRFTRDIRMGDIEDYEVGPAGSAIPQEEVR